MFISLKKLIEIYKNFYSLSKKKIKYEFAVNLFRIVFYLLIQRFYLIKMLKDRIKLHTANVSNKKNESKVIALTFICRAKYYSI